MASEYAMRGYLTDKADVYSFGVVALEIVSGKSNISFQPKLFLVDWVHYLKENGNLMELVDSRLGSDFNKEEIMVMINVALLCTDVSPTVRPTMSSVVSMLEGRAAVPESVADSTVTTDDAKFEAFRNYYQSGRDHTKTSNQSQSMSMDGPSTGSSTSAVDLYPVNLDSGYLNARD